MEISGRHAAIVRQSAENEPPGSEVLANEKLRIPPGQWVPVRVSFRGEQLAAQVADVTVHATHPSLGGSKPAFALMAQGRGVGFRTLRVTGGHP